MGRPVTDPTTVAAIEAAFMLAVYRAERQYLRRMAGLAEPPRAPVRLPKRLAAVARAASEGPGEPVG